MMHAETDLRPAQVRTIDELCRSRGIVLIVPMGGGKTVTALTAVNRLRAKRAIRAAIVLAPKRVINDAWPKDVKRWEQTVGLDLVVLRGSPAKRAALLKETHDVYVCGIDNLVWLLDELAKYPADDPRYDQLVIDELSKFKSPRGERAKYLRHRAHRFQAIWGLTGTPRPGKWDQLWMPLQIISADEAFGEAGFDDWQRARFRPLDYQMRQWEIHPFAIPEVMRIVNDWSVAVPPEECASVPFTSGEGYDVWLPMTEQQKQACAELSAQLFTALGVAPELIADDDETMLVALSQAVATGKMSQILQGFSYIEGQTAARWSTAKIDALAEMSENADGENVVLAYHYREDMEAIRKVFGDIPYLGAGVSDAKADRIMAAWNAGDIPRLMLHPASAGHGVELQHGGFRLFWYCPTWSPELYSQTVKRLARPGQTRPVFSHRIMMDHWLERKRVARVERAVASEQEFMAQIRRV